jgi:kinesin family protein 6/9
MLPVQSEEDALNLLFVGDTNRIICETPSNDSSSRSHCVFTIYVEAQDSGSSVVRTSKVACAALISLHRGSPLGDRRFPLPCGARAG